MVRAQELVWWDADKQRVEGFDVPDFAAGKPPDYRPKRGASGEDAIPGDHRS